LFHRFEAGRLNGDYRHLICQTMSEDKCEQ
jgi:hypothetical protein